MALNSPDARGLGFRFRAFVAYDQASDAATGCFLRGIVISLNSVPIIFWYA